ncbi:hypothetical protein C0Q70_13997 [Pomacea canaliculata]|uniref:Uncharacterized protein n=1 Tax=Pomacea canaliculata TaxID=400727 RepID=A0A2T7NYU7_POMCA|nr:hypothetical protein C0Q70_13997 [Pomacea canaliculata]
MESEVTCLAEVSCRRRESGSWSFHSGELFLEEDLSTILQMSLTQLERQQEEREKEEEKDNTQTRVPRSTTAGRRTKYAACRCSLSC